jgi:DNA-binding transcriptional regulator YiaG
MSSYCLDQVSDTSPVSPLRTARENAELSREAVARRPELEPPISSKTLERWEVPGARVKQWRLKQLARIYGVTAAELRAGS